MFTCHILAQYIQADTDHRAALLCHQGGMWGWSCCGFHGGVIVVEVVVEVENVVPKWGEPGGRGGREDTGELRPLLVTSLTHLRPCFHFVVPFVLLSHITYIYSLQTIPKHTHLKNWPLYKLLPKRTKRQGTKVTR